MSIIAADTGGTFTDVIAVRGERVRVAKVPSTPAEPARAVLEGLRRVLSEEAEDFVLVHGSTVATNALLERRGARVALITNRGLEDVLEIGRQNRPHLYALHGEVAPALVAPEDRHGVAGRLAADGAEVAALDPAELARLAEAVRGVEAVAICLLHSYADPAHERAVAAALEATGLPISLSSHLLPEFREYERTATTVVNAYVTPLMDRYLAHLERDAGARRVRIMESGGGAIPVARARREAARTVLSGPAGGVAGAMAAGAAAGRTQLLTFDMGGTSTDVSLCPGRPLHTRAFTIAGLPVALPVLDIVTVGAGGGSLARVDAGGALRVGPGSAGADPGPICYGRGGTGVTVTDAHVWLGRLPPHAFLGGERALDRAAVEGPLRALAAAAGLEPDAAAEGVLRVANAAMEGALRVISVERGFDPGELSLVAFGGAAGLHAAELAGRLGVREVLVPPAPGALSAYGMLVAPIRREASRTVLRAADTEPAFELEPVFAELEAEARAAMIEEGAAPDAVLVHRSVDARYRGQSHELNVAAPDWLAAFHAAHEQRYGYAAPGEAVEAVTLRVEATVPVPALAPARLLEAPADGGSAAAPEPARGRVVCEGRILEAFYHRRRDLRPGSRVQGPAVVAEYTATTWVPEGWAADVDPSGSLVLART
ncbi:MAG: hydantoinase/oxoprolinase family protein [Gemmatimonadota bacterium]